MKPFKKLKNAWPILFVILASCSTTVTIPDVEWCTSTGNHGAICQNSSSDTNRTLTDKEWIDFLENGPALCTSSKDFSRIKTAIQQLCNENSKCKFETLKATFKRLDKLSSRNR